MVSKLFSVHLYLQSLVDMFFPACHLMRGFICLLHFYDLDFAFAVLALLSWICLLVCEFCVCLAEFFLLKIILKNPGGGGFKYFFIFTAYLGKISNLTSISFRWVGSTTQLGIHGKNLHLFGWPGSTFPLKKTQPKPPKEFNRIFCIDIEFERFQKLAYHGGWSRWWGWSLDVNFWWAMFLKTIPERNIFWSN